MTRTRKGLIERLDAAAERTGIPQVVIGRPRRRHLRWFPLVPLGLGIGGFVAALLRSDWQSFGMAMVTVALGLAVLLPLLGPIKPWGSPERVDEFDRAVRDRAFLFAFAAISGVAALGIWLLVGLALAGNLPRELLITQMGLLGTLLFVLYSALPTLHASWATYPADED